MTDSHESALTAPNDKSTSRLVCASEKVSSVERLPPEILSMIIDYFSHDSFTILHLLLVSKTWYNLLTRGSQAESRWERRCKSIDDPYKMEGTSWRRTFLRLLRTRCACCLATAGQVIGPCLLHGYRFLRVCTACARLPGPLKWLIKAEAQQLLSSSRWIQLADAPAYRLGSPSVQEWYLDGTGTLTPTYRYLRAAIDQLLLREEPTERAVLAAIEKCSGNKTLLRDAIDHYRYDSYPPLPALDEAMKKFACDATKGGCNSAPVLKVYQTLRSLLSDLREQLRKQPGRFIDFDSMKSPRLYSLKISTTFTWLECLLNGTATIEDYIQAARPGLLKAEQEVHMEILQQLEERKAKPVTRPSGRLTGVGPVAMVTQDHTTSGVIAPNGLSTGK